MSADNGTHLSITECSSSNGVHATVTCVMDSWHCTWQCTPRGSVHGDTSATPGSPAWRTDDVTMYTSPATGSVMSYLSVSKTTS